MQNSRISNALRSSSVNILLKIYQILMPFLIRSLLIHFMGIQFSGLDGLFASVLQVLNLAELGVGSAMVYSMYKPVAENDSETIRGLLYLYRNYYRIIGLLILMAGLGLIPFLPYLIRGGIPNTVNLTVIYLLNLAGTVSTYWLFAYKNSLFQAHQRMDLTGMISIGTYTLRYILQILSICVFKNYYLYLISSIISQILTNLQVEWTSRKYYSDYFPKNNLTKKTISEINGRIRDLFTAKLGTVIVNSTDSIIISAFLGLVSLALYQNYYLILTSVISVMTSLFAALTPGIGNSLIIESQSKNYRDLLKLTYIIFWISCWITSSLLCLYQPFIQTWLGSEYLLNFSAVILFCIYFYIFEMNQLLNTFKDAAGCWHLDRWRPLVTALSNLGISMLLVVPLGIYGVLLGTILSTVFIGMPWLIRNLFQTIFTDFTPKQYVLKLLYYALAALISSTLCLIVCRAIVFTGIFGLIIKALICLVLSGITCFLMTFKSREFNESFEMLAAILRSKIRRTR